MAKEDQLNFIDKIKFRYRVWQAERVEDKRQAIEHDDRIPIDKQKIINDILAEKSKRENKKNNVKLLSSPENKPVQKVPNTLKQYKVPSNTIKSAVELQLDQMLGKELNSERDAYDNIVELQNFLSYPHDDIPDVENRINKKLFHIQNRFGKNVLNTGMQIYENDKYLKDVYSTMSLADRMKKQEEIVRDPKLSEQLNEARYHPKQLKKSSGKAVSYQAVFCKMIENDSNEKSEDRASNEIA